MNYRDKFLVQIMVCLAIFVGLRGVAMIDDEGFSEIKSTLNRYISKNYSLEEIKEYLNTNLKELQKLSTSQLINKRYEKYRKIGQVF